MDGRAEEASGRWDGWPGGSEKRSLFRRHDGVRLGEKIQYSADSSRSVKGRQYPVMFQFRWLMGTYPPLFPLPPDPIPSLKTPCPLLLTPFHSSASLFPKNALPFPLPLKTRSLSPFSLPLFPFPSPKNSRLPSLAPAHFSLLSPHSQDLPDLVSLPLPLGTPMKTYPIIPSWFDKATSSLRALPCFMLAARLCRGQRASSWVSSTVCRDNNLTLISALYNPGPVYSTLCFCLWCWCGVGAR